MKQAAYNYHLAINNRYHILEPLGRGGTASVYLAHDEVLDRDVALKVLRNHFANDEEFVERFRREARISAALCHPNIASVYDLGETQNGSYYMAMEYVPGGTLRDLIRKEGPLAPNKAVEIVIQTARALGTAHAYGTIHRDIKPQNILLTLEQEVKVVDFGIARAAALSEITQEGHVLGTEHYMSPEQAKGARVGPQSDLYSLGVVLYEMIIGKLPHEACGPLLGITTAARRLSGYPHPPNEIDSRIPEKLSAIVVRLLKEDPRCRYQATSSLIADLERAKSESLGSVATRVLNVAFQKGKTLESATTRVLNLTTLQAPTAYKSKTRKTKPYTLSAPIFPHRPGKSKAAWRQRKHSPPRSLLLVLTLTAVLAFLNFMDPTAKARLLGEVERKLGTSLAKIEHNIDQRLENELQAVESKVVDSISGILMPSPEDQQDSKSHSNSSNNPRESSPPWGSDYPPSKKSQPDTTPGGSLIPPQNAPVPQTPSGPYNTSPGSPSYPSNGAGNSFSRGMGAPHQGSYYQQARQEVEKQIDENLQNLERVFGQ